MSEMGAALRPELLTASDSFIDDAVKHTDPMVLRGLIYQLTGDPALLAIAVKPTLRMFYEIATPATEDDAAHIRDKAARFLKNYRDEGAGPIDHGPPERLLTSLGLMVGEDLDPNDRVRFLEDLALDPWARALDWQSKPDDEALDQFKVVVIGAGMGGLNAAVQLKRAGIPYQVFEKNHGVGGTWHENRYPGARVDSPSRSYTNIFGADFCYPNAFCEWTENQKYFNWVADSFDVRKDIRFNTEVRSVTWDEASGRWNIVVRGSQGEETVSAKAVIAAVGFLNRPNVPDFAGVSEFRGRSFHTARWPEDLDVRGKTICVIGTGCTGYQMIPELARDAKHVLVFQRTPQWVFPTPGYRAPLPTQVNWLDRNLPMHTNFMRFRTSYLPFFDSVTDIDPNFEDADSSSAANKLARDVAIEFLHEKLGNRPDLLKEMTPAHPVWSARAVLVDPEYSIYDALLRDNVSLVTAGIRRITPTGLETLDGVQHEVDLIVYATGFHATEYLFPMQVTGRDGLTTERLWADGGARAYMGSMLPGFPNFWMLYGPNTNGGFSAANVHELTMLYAMKCIERLTVDGKRTVEAKADAYWRHNRMIDERNNKKVWSDPRAHNYYWSKHGRSTTQNPLPPQEIWRLLRYPNYADLEFL